MIKFVRENSIFIMTSMLLTGLVVSVPALQKMSTSAPDTFQASVDTTVPTQSPPSVETVPSSAVPQAVVKKSSSSPASSPRVRPRIRQRSDDDGNDD